MEFVNASKVYRKSGGSPTIAFAESTVERTARLQPCRKWPVRSAASAAAEKLASLKGTAFRPYITAL
jgi:hypothetical protein